MEPPEDMVVDHIDHNGLNNRKSNLREWTLKQNNLNRRDRRGTSSEYKGVRWRKREMKFLAAIRYNEKMTRICYFKDEAEAARAYDANAKKKLFGEYAYLNFSKE